MTSFLTCFSAVTDPSYNRILFETILLGLVFGLILGGAGLIVALAIVMDGSALLALLAIAVSALIIVGYIRLLIKLRRAKKALKARRKAVKTNPGTPQ